MYDYSLVAQLYRRLQRNYIDSYQYTEAGDFYIGEQEMIRKSKGGRLRQPLTTNFWYWLFARYGQCWVRPLLFGVLPTLFVWPLLLILCDIHTVLDHVNSGRFQVAFFDPTWLSDLTNVFVFSKYLAGVMIFNVKLLATGIFGGMPVYMSAWQCLLVIGERLLIIAFISFFVLALTRQFKRKSF